MSKSAVLNFTQNLNNISLQLNSADPYGVIAVAPTSNGTALTPGLRTFTAVGGTPVSGGVGAAQFTVQAVGAAGAASVGGIPVVTQPGSYVPGSGPTAAANAATVDVNSSNATFALTVGILKTLYTASTNDCVVKAINVASTDGTARTMSLWEQDPSGGYLTLLGSLNIPASSGSPSSGSAPSVDLLSGILIPTLPYDANGKRVLPLKAGSKLLVSIPAVSISTFVSVHAMVEEY